MYKCSRPFQTDEAQEPHRMIDEMSSIPSCLR